MSLSVKGKRACSTSTGFEWSADSPTAERATGQAMNRKRGFDLLLCFPQEVHALARFGKFLLVSGVR